MEVSASSLYGKAVPMQLPLQYCIFHNMANAVIHLAMLHNLFTGVDKPPFWKNPFLFLLRQPHGGSSGNCI